MVARVGKMQEGSSRARGRPRKNVRDENENNVTLEESDGEGGGDGENERSDEEGGGDGENESNDEEGGDGEEEGGSDEDYFPARKRFRRLNQQDPPDPDIGYVWAQVPTDMLRRTTSLATKLPSSTRHHFAWTTAFYEECGIDSNTMEGSVSSAFRCHLTPGTCHLTPGTCHLTPGTCHMSHVT